MSLEFRVSFKRLSKLSGAGWEPPSHVSVLLSPINIVDRTYYCMRPCYTPRMTQHISPVLVELKVGCYAFDNERIGFGVQGRDSKA